MMKENSNDQDYPCPCLKKTCMDCPLGFEKVIDLKNTGLVIYRHSMTSDKVNQNIGMGGSDLENDENGFIFHNTKDADIISKDFLPEMEKRAIKCARCRQIMEQAIKILQKVSSISKNVIIGICNHCKLKEHPCCECEGALKKFFESKQEEKNLLFTKEKVREWLSNVQSEFKGFFVDEKETDKERLKDYIEKYKGIDKKLLRARSEVRINQICRREHDKNERDLEIKELCHQSDEQEARPSPIVTDLNKKQIMFNLNDQLEVLGSTLTIPIERLTKSATSKSKEPSIRNEDQTYTSIISKKGKDSKKDDRFTAETYLTLGTQGRDYYGDDILPAYLSTQYAHDKEKRKSYEEELTDETRKTNFIFSFPFERKMEEKHKREKSSSELIHDIHDRIREKNEETERKNEEIHLKKIEEEERKQQARAEKIKITEEKKRLAEEKKLMEKERERKDAGLFDKSKDTFSLKDKTYKVGSTAQKQSKSEVDQKEHPHSRSKSQVPKSDLTESKMIVRKIKSDTKPKSKTDESSRRPKSDLASSRTEQKKTKDESEAKTKQKTESKHPKGKLEADTTQPKSELKTDSKQPKSEPKTDLKQLKAEQKADSKQANAESKPDSKLPKSEPKADSKQTKAEPKADSKQPKTDQKTDLKQLKVEPKADSKQPQAESKSDSKQVKAEPKTDSKQSKPEPKTDLKELKSEPKADSKQPKAESKTDSKQPKPESKTDSKQPKSESKTDSKEPESKPKADSKQTKAEPKADFKQPTAGPETGLEQLKAEPKADPKQYKPQTNAESKEPKGESKQAKSEAKAESKQHDTEQKSVKEPPKSTPKETSESKKSRKSKPAKSTDQSKEPKAVPKGPTAEPKESKVEPKQPKTEPKDTKAETRAESKQPKAPDLNGTKDSTKAEKVTEKSKKEKDKKERSPDEPRVPRRQLEAQQQKALEDSKINKKPKKELNVNQISMLGPSQNYLVLDLVKVKTVKRTLSQIMTPSQMHIHEMEHKIIKEKGCPMCINSNLELEYETRKKRIIDQGEMIKGREIRSAAYAEGKDNQGVKPILFQIKYDDKFHAEIIEPPKHIRVVREYPEERKPTKTLSEEESKGVIHYALSDRTFIEKGWTMLPTEKVVRKMNVYRMRPAHPEFDWFEHNKNKRLMSYDTGERLAEFDDDGRGRWYYRNQRLALQYYDAEELNAQQRFVIYSNGEPDERGRTRPYTILATFDYLGNGIVFDHSGKIRMKYNQTEGVVLDRNIGPASHWKWHTLNDPPVLQQVMIDTHLSHKDPQILKMGTSQDKHPRPDNEDMLTIEFDNFIREKSKKLSQTFKPFQIKMKALKINEHFSLKVLDQANVYLIYRDGTTNIKLNLGMLLDHKEIVDTDTAEVGEVANNMERLPARTDSLAAMQKSVAYAQHFERSRTERERRLQPPVPSVSADKLNAAISRPLQPPLRSAHSSTATPSLYPKSRKPSINNVYYDNRLF